MREIKFRGKRKDNGEWIVGYFIGDDNRGKVWMSEGGPYGCVEVIPETIGQLRYENKHGRYFDGDIYYCAGFGLDVVSELCEIHYRLMHGNIDDIGEIKGNIHDNPELLKPIEQ